MTIDRITQIKKERNRWNKTPMGVGGLNEALDFIDELLEFVEQHVENGFDSTRQVSSIWSIEDVQSVRPDLSDEQAMEVLEDAKRNSEIGLNWQVINDIADDLFPEPEV